MATSGTFSKAYRGYTYQISWSANQNIEGNYSTITCTHKLICAASYSLYISGRTNSCEVNGSSQSFSSSAISTSSGNVTYTLGTTKHRVNHKSDGTATLSVKGIFKMQATISGVYVDNITTTGTATLTTIPRTSSLSLSVSEVNVGGSITANITRSSTNFKHTVEFYINNSYKKTYNNVTVSQSFTIPDSWYNAMPSATSCTAYCRITTYNGSTPIGSTVQKSFKVKVPSSIKPTVGDITFNPANITIDGTNYNRLVKGHNKLSIKVGAYDSSTTGKTNCTAGKGSTIKSYTFSGPSLSTTKTTSATSCIASVNSVSSSGNLTYTVTVTDARGRSASKTASVTCYDYYTPSFSSFSVSRSADGKAINYKFKIKCADIGKINTATVKIYVNTTLKTTCTKIANNIETKGQVEVKYPASTYTVYAVVHDALNPSTVITSKKLTCYGTTKIFNVHSSGTGFAFGEVATAQRFTCRWPSLFRSEAKFESEVSGPSGFKTTSDERAKINIQDIDIDVVDSLRPIQYQLKYFDDGKLHYGFVAQDVANILMDAQLNPENMGIIGHITQDDQYLYTLSYTEFIPLVVKKCQELQKENNEMRAEIAEIKQLLLQTSSE